MTEVKDIGMESRDRVFTGVLTCCAAFIFIFLLIISLAGCNNSYSVQTQNDEPYSIEQRKKELLLKLDRSFENPEAQFELGQIYHTEKQWAQAQFRYNQALSFDPIHRDAQAAMVKLFNDRGEPIKAANYAENYINQASASSVHSLNLALAFQELGLDDYAMTCYQQALSISPDSADVHRELGYFFLSRDDKVNAEMHFVRSYNSNYRQPDVAYELGKLGVVIGPSALGENE